MTQTPSTVTPKGNNLFAFRSEQAAAAGAANTIAGINEFYFGEFDNEGNVILASLVSSAGIRQGDIGPTPEATTSDNVYDDGSTRTVATGLSLGSKTIDIEGPLTDGLIKLLRKYSPYGTKPNQLAAFVAFNDDRSAFYGSTRVSSAVKPRDVSGIWRFNIPWAEVLLRDPDQNPAPTEAGVPTGSFAPTTGPVGTSVTITGTNLDALTSLSYGTATVDAASFGTQTATSVAFTVPTGQADGVKDVIGNYEGGTVDFGDFTQTA